MPSPPIPEASPPVSTALPPELLDPPDVTGLVHWIRQQRNERLSDGNLHHDEAVERALESLAEVLHSSERHDPPLAAILGREDHWKIQLHPKLQTHRGTIGKWLIALKRYIVWPVIRWHVEFTEDNARKQRQLDSHFMHLIGHLAGRITLLEREIELLRSEQSQDDSPPPSNG